MSDEKLEAYIKTIEPNFNSHLEKGTIEMSNEYFNLLEERMARLINENQELKKQKEEKENQQKEFINYINAYIELFKDIPDLVEEGQKDILEEILSKYKEIIGGKDE